MNYHNYFVSLEDRFSDLSKYVEIDPNNYSAFSTEIALIYMAACSEFEVVAKELCEVLEPGFKATYLRANIDNIADVFTKDIPEIMQEEVVLAVYGSTFKPLDNWARRISPSWWISYNNVKHSRATHYSSANLENLINALAALEIVNYYYIWKSKCPTKARSAPPCHMDTVPSIFMLKDISYTGASFDNDFFDDI